MAIQVVPYTDEWIPAVLAFNVSARRNEIGIRMALGAAPSRVTTMIPPA